MRIDIESNINLVIEDVEDYSGRQIPFAVRGAVNRSLFDARKMITKVTWPKAVTVRNRNFINAVMNVNTVNVEQAKMWGAGLLPVMTGSLNDKATVGKGGDRPWLRSHAEGGVKEPARSASLAVPSGEMQGYLRAPTGKVRKRNKPRQIVERKGFFEVGVGQKKLILRRTRGEKKPTLVFTIGIKEATIRKSFRFHEDSRKVVLRVFPGHFNTEFKRALMPRR